MLRVLSLGLLLAAFGCSSLPSGPYAERNTVNASVVGIIKAFDRAAIGIRGRSANGRELVSKYHLPGGDGYDYAGDKPERAYSKLRILGERRPYTLQVQYVIEKRNSKGVYIVTDYDLAKAESILKDLIKYLVTRPGREDFIDDFRPF
jgi:hypothetical protein